MNDLKKEKILEFLLIVLVSILINFIFTFIVNKSTYKNIQQTQTVNINAKEEKEKIDINKASKKELLMLPNIGEKTADKIIQNRPYKSIYELINIEGLGEETIKELEGRIKVE